MPIMSNTKRFDVYQKVIIIIAGTFKQFDDFRRALRHTPYVTYVYADNPKNLNGIEADEIIYIGTWTSRKDLPELEEAARARLKGDKR